MGLGETPSCLIRKRYRYYSREKFEDTVDNALDLMQTKSSDAVFLAVFRTLINADRKPEVAGDVISGMALAYVGMDVPASKEREMNQYLIAMLLIKRPQRAIDPKF